MLIPFIRTLQANFPKATLTWIISPLAHELVSGMKEIEFIVEKPNSIVDYWRFKKKLKHRHFDVLFACQASLRANLLYACISATRKIGYDKLRAKDCHHWFIGEAIMPGDDHTLEGFLKFSSVLGVTQKHVQWNLPITAADYDWARQQLPPSKKVLIVNPAASRKERNWLLERYIALLREVKRRWDFAIVLTGGPAPYERELALQIAQVIPCTNLVGKTKPRQLLALISLAQLVLCPDTGPSHMAATVGTPVIALHAVTGAAVSGPYPFLDLAIDCYPQARDTLLKKNRASNRWGTHVHGFEAMKLITVEAVLKKFEEFFIKYNLKVSNGNNVY